MLSPSEVVFLFADLQEDIIKNAKTNEPKTIRATVGTAATIAASLSIPAIASVAQMSATAPVPVEDITEALPELPVFPRRGPHVFMDETTKAALAKTGKRTIAICGVAMEIVVLHAALAARAEGYTVYVLLDASGGFSERTENAAIRQIEAAGGITTSLASFATSMVSEFTTPEGGAVIGALRKLWSR